MVGKPANFKKILFILLLWALPSLAVAVTPPLPAQPSRNVVDLAGVLDADTQTRLNARLQDLEAETTAQVVVLTINSLDGEPIENFSHQTAVKWGIGQKGKDNGILITVAVKDHKYRIEVGYGLESALPDSLVGSLGRQYLVPNFKKGDYAGGISAAVTEIISELTKTSDEAAGSDTEQTAPAPETATPSPPEAPSQLGLIITILAVILLLPAIALIGPRLFWAKKRGQDGGFRFWGGSSGSSSSWGSGDSGGFSGGGGDFGGGGASGDW